MEGVGAMLDIANAEIYGAGGRTCNEPRRPMIAQLPKLGPQLNGALRGGTGGKPHLESGGPAQAMERKRRRKKNRLAKQDDMRPWMAAKELCETERCGGGGEAEGARTQMP